MQAKHRTQAHARLLPTEKPVQLHLPGVPTRAETYLKPLYKYGARYRVPVAVLALIAILYLTGQGTFAGSIAVGYVLYRLNVVVDRAMQR